MLIINVNNQDLERSLKIFKNKVGKTQLIKELNNRKYYKKKSDINRQILKNAIYKEQKYNLD